LVTVSKEDGFGVWWCTHEKGFTYRVFSQGNCMCSADSPSLDLVKLVSEEDKQPKEVLVILHTTNGDVVTSFPSSCMDLVKDLIVSYLRFGKSFSVKQ